MISRFENLLPDEPLYQYVTYSYKEGLANVSKIIAVASIFAFISMIISMIIGIRKKDCIAILAGNIMMKTILIALYQALDDLLSAILFFIVAIFIEGIIYQKVLKFKKYSGMKVSVIYNISTIVIMLLMFMIIGEW